MCHSGRSSALMEVAVWHRVTFNPQLWPSTLWYVSLVLSTHSMSHSVRLSFLFLLQNTDYMMSVCSTECDRSNIFVCFLKEKNSQYVYPNNTWRLRLMHWFYAHALVQYIAHIHCRMSHIHSVYKQENPLWCGSQIGFVIIFSPYDNVVWLCVYNVLQVTKAGGWTRSSEQSSG